MKKLLYLMSFFGLFQMNQAQNHYWTKSFGGTETERGVVVAADANGDVYTAGTFSSLADFDPGIAIHTLTPIGELDLFLNKLDASGNFIWNKRIGGTAIVRPGAIHLDAQGNIFITGSFNGTADFDPGSGTFMVSSQTIQYDVFILKLDVTGNFVWVKSFGGDEYEFGNDMDFDLLGNFYTCGGFWDVVDFDPGPGTFTLGSSTNAPAAFVSKFDQAGNFLWARCVESFTSGYSVANDLIVDGSGDVCLTGNFVGFHDFDPGQGTFNLSSVNTPSTGPSSDVFVLKLNSSGSFVWARQMGDKDYDCGTSIVNDAFGNMYVTGYFRGTVDIDPGTAVYNLISNGGSDIFVCSLSPSGALNWAGSFGSASNYEWPTAAEIQPGGDLYLAGMIGGTPDFDIGQGIFNLTAPAPLGNIFILRLKTTGGFVWATILQSNSSGLAEDIFTGPNDVIYLTGSYNDTLNVDPGISNLKIVSAGKNDVFVQKLGPPLNTGSFELSLSEAVHVYPNPADKELYIHYDGNNSSDATYQLIDPLGRVVLNGLVNETKTKVDVSNLPRGLYLVHLESATVNGTKKVVISY